MNSAYTLQIHLVPMQYLDQNTSVWSGSIGNLKEWIHKFKMDFSFLLSASTLSCFQMVKGYIWQIDFTGLLIENKPRSRVTHLLKTCSYFPWCSLSATMSISEVWQMMVNAYYRSHCSMWSISSFFCDKREIWLGNICFLPWYEDLFSSYRIIIVHETKENSRNRQKNILLKNSSRH